VLLGQLQAGAQVHILDKTLHGHQKGTYLHVGTFATTRVAPPIGVGPGDCTNENAYLGLTFISDILDPISQAVQA
jgi:hypothetical protein